MEVVVFGAGSLGSLLGGLLARHHEVTLVGREPHVATVQAAGLRISGEVETRVHPQATTDLPPGHADLAVVAVKSYDTADAARTLAEVEFDAVLSLQNGLGNEERLAAHCTSPVLAGTCTYGARLVDAGHVECTGVGEVLVGPREGGHSAVAAAVADAFDRAGVVTTAATDVPVRLWEKLAINAAINPVTALARVPNGALADGLAGTIARQAALETAAVARTRGVELAEERAIESLERVIEETAGNRSSMLQDVDRGRRTEIDAINGAVVERAAGSSASVDVPINETLTGLVRAWERERGLR